MNPTQASAPQRRTLSVTPIVALVAVIACLVAVLSTTGAQAATASPRVTARWTGSVNIWDKAAVNRLYWSQWAAQQSVSTNWNGNTSTCNPGTNNYSSNVATLTALNYARSLSGLLPVGQTYALNANARAAALIMAANKRLSHTPTSDWRCYTSVGANTARVSNILLAQSGLGSGRVADLYMDEPGATNYAVGHRRWLLNPFTTHVGTASTSTSNAIQVANVPSSYSRPNPAYVAWPNIGYAPNPMEPNGRWSLSGQKNMDFSRATVTVTTGGANVAVSKQTVKNGYAMPTIVWQMPTGFNKNASYRVTVRGIRWVGTTSTTSFSYPTHLFTPVRVTNFRTLAR